jgi:hypothetical protein
MAIENSANAGAASRAAPARYEGPYSTKISQQNLSLEK